MVRDRGLHEKCAILAGVTPFKSVGMAKYMKNSVPGMDVPDELIERMKGVPKEKQSEEGIKMCVESIQRLREIPGCGGFISWRSSGRRRWWRLPRPQASFPDHNSNPPLSPLVKGDERGFVNYKKGGRRWQRRF